MEKNKMTTNQVENKNLAAEPLNENQEEITDKQLEEELNPEEDTEASDIEKLNAQIQQLTDQNLRQYAEFDNYRKRTQREKLETYKTATADCALEFIAVLDNLERALDSSTEESEIKSGVEMIAAQFTQVLEKMNITPIPAENEQFNPELHNAVTQIKDENYGENTICQVLRKGYRTDGKVIRPAMVVVANP